MINMLIVAALSAGVLSFILAAILIYSSTVFHVETDETVEKIIEVLPSVNCGACGEASCTALAEKLARGEASINACVPGGSEVAEKLAQILGLEADPSGDKMRAYVFCQGGNDIEKESIKYVGVQSCAAATLSGTERGCAFGCLGFGDCLDVCKFDAIIMGDDGIPKIDEEKCVACGACVKACPRGIIEIHPSGQEVHVYCRSHYKGALAKSLCKHACIACGLCVKKGPSGGAYMNNNLAQIDYENYVFKAEDLTAFKCPTNVITSEKINVIKKKVKQ